MSRAEDPYALTPLEARRVEEGGLRQWWSFGIIYLLHFSSPYHHAQHYLGWSRDQPHRLEEHLRGKGSPLVAAVVGAGINVELVRTWEGDRHQERALKDRHNLRVFCPKCQDAIRTRERERMRRSRA